MDNNLPAYDETTPIDASTLPAYEDTTPEGQVPSKLESLVRGAAQGASMGFADEITGALESATSDKSYQQARDESRANYKSAEEANPKTFMGGEFGGAAATALIPGLGEATIPKLAAQGAAYGLGSSNADLTSGKVEDMEQAAKDTAKGGAVGTVLGLAGKALTKALPAVAKTAVSTLGPSTEAIENRLAGGAASAVSPTAEGQVLEGITNDLWNKISKQSAKAQSYLNPESYTTLDEVYPIFKNLKQDLQTQGGLVGDDSKAATEVLDNWFKDLVGMTKNNNGVVPEPALGEFIRKIDQSVPKWDSPHSDVIDSVQKQLRGALNQALKTSNPEYAKAMEPVKQLIDLANDTKKAFNLAPSAGKLEATDVTNSKLANVLNENKSHARDTLKKLEELYGHPFEENLQTYKYGQEFEKGTPVAGLGLLGKSANLVGVDGGAVAKNIVDAYLSAKGNVENTAAGQALQKYGPLLADAAKKGGNALAATHFVLATSDPAYQELVEKHQEGQ
jgi:hypothetical protein